MEEAVRKVLHKAINDNIFPGAVVGIAENKKRSIIPLGTIDSTDTAVTNHTIYDVASVTKAIPTSSLALYFLDKNVIQLNNSVTKFLPKFRHRDVTIWHLLTQTVAFGNSSNPLILSQLKDLSAFEIMESIYSADLSFVPGTRYAYTNATSIVLGNVLEAVGGNNLDQLASDIFFIPLGMSHTSFHPLQQRNSTIAPSEVDKWRGGVVQGRVHDESAYILGQEGVVGSAGLFSNAPDLLLFLTMLLNRGYSEGKQFLTEKMVSAMYNNQLEEIGLYSGLGWEIHQEQYMGKYMTESMFGKTGFTGCLVLLDIVKQKAMVFLSNYTYPKRKENSQSINQVRSAVADLVFSH